MDVGSFYGRKGLRTRLPPEDKSDDSCLSDSDDDDVDYDPYAQARAAPLGESSSSSEDENGDVVALPTACAKQTVKWKKTDCREQREIPSWNPGAEDFIFKTVDFLGLESVK